MPPIQLTYTFETEDEVRAHLAAQVRTDTPEPAPAPAVTPEPTTVPAPAETDTNDGPSRTDVDVDGMPWDAEIHSTPPVFKADGKWRAKRGHAEAEAAARAAFKAKGADTVAPDTTDAPMPGMPGMPSMSPAPVEDAPEPVDMAKLVDKTMGMMQRGQMTEDVLKRLYQEVVGGDPNVFSTNETARATMYAKLCEIEPDAP